MRPLALLAALALLAGATPAGAAPSIPASRAVIIPPEGPAPRESAIVRITPSEGVETKLAVEIEITYPPDVRLPDQDILHIGRADPTRIDARDEQGRPLAALSTGDHAIVVKLDRSDWREPPARYIRVRFEQPVPALRRYGWRDATTEIYLGQYSFQVSRGVTTVVILSEDTHIPGFDCRRGGGRTECTRTTPKRMEPVPLVLRGHLDRLGLALLVITSLTALYGFVRMARKRARELIEAARAPVLPGADRPGGAYRAPPAKAIGAIGAIGAPAGDATEDLRRLARNALAIALTVLGSTAAVALLAAGRSPWPMPSVTAAWVALAGFVAALAVERA